MEEKEAKRLSYADCKRMATEILRSRGKPPYEPDYLGISPDDEVKLTGAQAEARILSDFVQNWLDNKTDPIVIEGDKAP